MSQERQIELTLEMAAGDFSLRLNGITMNVRLKGGGPDGPPEPAAAGPPALPDLAGMESRHLAQEVAFYRQASEEIYAGLGRLAKEIHLSIQDLSLAEVIQSTGTSPGERLDQARHQLNDVLAMTERATLDILDLVEQIRQECQVVERLLTPQGQLPEEPLPGPGPDPLTRIKVAVQEFGDYLASHLPPPPSFPAGPAVAVSLADTLQMLLEFCGTEAVKPHLKSLVAQHAGLFEVAAAERALSALAAQAPVEDGFYQLPLEQVLALLQEHCREPRARELLAKLIASAGKIFPVSALPLEGQPQGPPAVSPPEDSLAGRWQAFLAAVAPALESLDRQETEPPLAADRTMTALAATGRIRDSLSRITETLSFQDLSGQRLLKVLKILRQVQIQVLTLLIAIGTKLRLKSEGQEISLQEGELRAQEELVRMLGHPDPATQAPAGADAPDREPLDQEAVNELLASLGF